MLLVFVFVGLGFNVFAACLSSTSAEKLQKESSDRVQTLILNVTKNSSRNEALKFVQSCLPSGAGISVFTPPRVHFQRILCVCVCVCLCVCVCVCLFECECVSMSVC